MSDEEAKARVKKKEDHRSRVDDFFLVAFPCMFLIFNLIYWPTCLSKPETDRWPFYPLTQCLKITQNVAFEFSTNFLSIKTDLSGNTVRPQTSGFQKLAKMDHFGDFALTFVHSKRSSLFLWFSNTVRVPLISTWIIKFSIVLQPMTRRVGWKETHRAHNGGRAQPILHAGPSLGHLHQSLASYRQHAW